jgi:hypothetical protein
VQDVSDAALRRKGLEGGSGQRAAFDIMAVKRRQDGKANHHNSPTINHFPDKSEYEAFVEDR